MMNEITLKDIGKLINQVRKHAGAKPNLQILRCSSCDVLYSYIYDGENPNIETEDHKEDCYFKSGG